MTEIVNSVERVRAALQKAGHPDTIEVFPDGTRTAQDAAAAVGCTVAQIAKSIVLRAGEQAVLIMTSGVNRVDQRGPFASPRKRDPEIVYLMTLNLSSHGRRLRSRAGQLVR